MTQESLIVYHYLLVKSKSKQKVAIEAQQKQSYELPISYLFHTTSVEIYYTDY